ncbi:MAG: four helix bundle protein [Nitrospirae bacterium]|nr:four helix bundle protein [Nitrospirota bacterium]
MDDKKDCLKTFEELNCWKTCREVRQYIAKIVKNYPNDEKYRLIDDMLRAARSTTHNIAEGFGRFHYQENAQFCRISRGSLYELRDQLICSLDEGFITADEYKNGLELIAKATTLLNGYINYLSKKRITNK